MKSNEEEIRDSKIEGNEKKSEKKEKRSRTVTVDTDKGYISETKHTIQANSRISTHLTARIDSGIVRKLS